MKNIKTTITAAAFAASLTFFATNLSAGEPNTLSAEEKKNGWMLLFDGKSTEHWKNYRKDAVGKGWVVQDGAIVWKGRGAGDIITKDQFESYELVLEYKISKGGNSGLMFGVTEEENTPWKTGPEIQIQDNVDGHDPQKAGWLYQLYKPDTDATKPPGEWNELRLKLVKDGTSTVWMNGVKYYDFVQGSDDWDSRVAKSKFAKMPKFGKHKKGHICLQDHGNDVAFRNIKIRKL